MDEGLTTMNKFKIIFLWGLVDSVAGTYAVPVSAVHELFKQGANRTMQELVVVMNNTSDNASLSLTQQESRFQPNPNVAIYIGMVGALLGVCIAIHMRRYRERINRALSNNN